MNNYQKHITQIQNLKGKPSLLLHVCCGVCSVYPLKYLKQYFNITIYYANSNIYPYEEYEKRLNAVKQYLDILDDKDIKIIIPKYDNDSFNDIISTYKDEPEGGKRCYLCYETRMNEAYKYASDHKYDYFTTIMSISRRKNADWLNEIGEKLQLLYPNTKYLYADFKKADGITENEKMNKKLNLYHQSYCGCVYSLSELSNKE